VWREKLDEFITAFGKRWSAQPERRIDIRKSEAKSFALLSCAVAWRLERERLRANFFLSGKDHQSYRRFIGRRRI